MAVYGKMGPTPEELMAKVRPRTGPPVPNMGGIVKQPVMSPTPPVRPPAVQAGPPGPTPIIKGMLGTVEKLKGIVGAPAPGTTPAAPVAAPPSPAQPAETPRQRAERQAAQRGGAPAAGDPLETQIGDYITKALGGGAGAYDDAMVSRYKAAAKSAAEGQRQATVDTGNEDLASRGLFRSGIGARMAADASRGAGASYTQAVADIMNQKATADQAARESALQGALGLYQTKTGNQLQREQMAAQNRGGGGGPKTFQYMDPDSGISYDLPLELLG